MPVAFLKIAEPYFEGAGGPKALFSVPFFTKYPTVVYFHLVKGTYVISAPSCDVSKYLKLQKGT